MSKNPPYVSSPGNIIKVLSKISEAATPERFTQDFLETKLGMSGGSVRPLIPFLKRLGFLSADGKPTDLYKQYRNPSESGRAVAEAMKVGYRDLYQINEYAHDLGDTKLKGAVTQLTGLESDSRVVQLIVGSFKALKDMADFDSTLEEEEPVEPQVNGLPPPENKYHPPQVGNANGVGMNLSYTINLNLPATSDISVFNAIFKSLREHLLRGDQ